MLATSHMKDRMEPENTDVSMEVVAPAEHMQPELAAHEQHAQEQPSSDDKEMNFRAMREELKRMKQSLEERDAAIAAEAEARLALERRLEQERQQQQQPVVEEEDYQISEDDWVTGRDFNKALEKRMAKEFERREKLRLEEEAKRRAEAAKKELPDRLQKEFPDFEEVVTKENVDYLRKNKPHIVATLQHCPDEYSRAVAAYDYIKSHCPNIPKEDKQKAELNASRPGTMGNAQGSAALSQAKAFERGLSPDLAKSLYQETLAAAGRL